MVLLRISAAVAPPSPAGRPGGADRMEGEGADFFARVEAGYAALAAADPIRWRVVDGSGPIDEVAALVAAAAR